MSGYIGLVEFDNVTAIAQTDKALLVVIEDEEYWIPQNQICEDSEVYKKDDKGVLMITEWIAEKLGLI